MSTLGVISGQLRLDVKSAIAGYAAVRAANARTIFALRSSSAAFLAFGKSATVAGALLVGVFAKAVTSAAEFERRLDFFGAVSAATTKEMEAVRAKALELGRDTIYSANQIAESFVELGKAGVSSQQILDGVGQSVTSLGAAADIPLTTAANIMLAAVQTFNLAAKDAVHVADLLSGAANASTLDVQDLGVSLKYAGGVASALNIPIEDVITSLSLLGKAGIRGSTAGTSLRQVLIGLTGSTKPAENALKKLGIITKTGANQFFDAQGKIKPLADVFQLIQDRTKGLGDAEKLVLFKDIFNTRALPSVVQLTKAGTQGFADMNAEISKTTAADVAAKRLDNLSGDLEILRGNLETIFIEGGAPFQEFFRGIVQGITSVLQGFSQLSPETQKLIFSIIAITGATLLLMGTFSLVVGTVLKFADTMIKLGTALKLLGKFMKAAALAAKGLTLALLTNPFFLIVAAIAAVVIALVLLYKHSETARNIMNAVWAAIKTGFQAVISFFQAAPGWLAGVWNSITSGVSAAWNAIVTFFQTSLAKIKAIWDTIWLAIVTTVGVYFNIAKTIILTYINIYRTIITTGINAILAVWGAVWGKLGGLIKDAFDLVRDIIVLVLAVILSVIYLQLKAVQAIWNAGWTVLKTVVGAVLNAVRAVVSAALSAIRSVISTAMNAVKAVWQAVWGFLGPYVIGVLSAIRSGVTAAFNAVRSVVTSVMSAIRSVVTTVWNAIASVVTSVLNRIRSIIQSVMSAVQGIVTRAWSRIKNIFTTGVNNAVKVVNEIGPRILGKLRDLVSQMASIGSDIINGLVNGLRSGIGLIDGVVEEITSHIPGPVKKILGIGSPSKVMMAIGKDTVAGLAIGLAATGPIVAASLALGKTTVAKVKDGLTDGIDAKYAGNQIVLGLRDGILERVDTIENAVAAVTNRASGTIAKLPEVFRDTGRMLVGDLANVLQGGSAPGGPAADAAQKLIETIYGDFNDAVEQRNNLTGKIKSQNEAIGKTNDKLAENWRKLRAAQDEAKNGKTAKARGSARDRVETLKAQRDQLKDNNSDARALIKSMQAEVSAISKSKIMSAKIRSDVTTALIRDAAVLDAIAAQREQLADRIKEATDAYNDAVNQRTEFAKDVSGSLTSFFSVLDVKATEADQGKIDELSGKAELAQNKLERAQEDAATAATSLSTAQARLSRTQAIYGQNSTQAKAAAEALAKAQRKVATTSDAVTSAQLASTKAQSALTDAQKGEALSAQLIVKQMQQRLDLTRAFVNNIRALKSAGLNEQSLRELIAAGPEAASATASALAQGGGAAIAELNRQQSEMASLATEFGNQTAGWFYDAGVQAAQGLLQGLQQQDSALAAQMQSIASALVNSVRNALGIHSPSRVMRDLFGEVPAGAALGIAQGISDVASQAAIMSQAVIDAQRALIDPARFAQSLSKLAATPTSPLLGVGTVPTGSIPVAGGDGANSVTYGDVFQLTTNTNASAPEIMDEFAWASRVRGLGGI